MRQWPNVMWLHPCLYLSENRAGCRRVSFSCMYRRETRTPMKPGLLKIRGALIPKMISRLEGFPYLGFGDVFCFLEPRVGGHKGKVGVGPVLLFGEPAQVLVAAELAV